MLRCFKTDFLYCFIKLMNYKNFKKNEIKLNRLNYIMIVIKFKELLINLIL